MKMRDRMKREKIRKEEWKGKMNLLDEIKNSIKEDKQNKDY